MEKTVVKKYGTLSDNWIARFLELNRFYVKLGDEQFTDHDPDFLSDESVKIVLMDYNQSQE